MTPKALEPHLPGTALCTSLPTGLIMRQKLSIFHPSFTWTNHLAMSRLVTKGLKPLRWTSFAKMLLSPSLMTSAGTINTKVVNLTINFD